MSIQALLLLSICSICIGQKDNCPYSADIAPCTCDHEGINCAKARDSCELRTVLQSYVTDPRFRNFWMKETPLTGLEDDTFANYLILKLHIQHNRFLEQVGDNAFARHPQNFTMDLELNANRLGALPLVALGKLRALSYLDFGGNLIETIPDYAFKDLPALNTVILSGNRIRHLGRCAFASQSNIAVVLLDGNLLTVVGREAFANPEPYSFRLLDLHNNQIQRVEPGAFEGTENFGQLVLSNNSLRLFNVESFSRPLQILSEKQSSTIVLTDNPVACDHTLLWVLEFPDTIRSKIVGLHCRGKHIRYVEQEDLLN